MVVLKNHEEWCGRCCNCDVSRLDSFYMPSLLNYSYQWQSPSAHQFRPLLTICLSTLLNLAVTSAGVEHQWASKTLIFEMLARVHSLLLLTVGVIFMYARYDAIENSANQLVCVCVCVRVCPRAQMPVSKRARPFSRGEGARAGNWGQNRWNRYWTQNAQIQRQARK